MTSERLNRSARMIRNGDWPSAATSTRMKNQTQYPPTQIISAPSHHSSGQYNGVDVAAEGNSPLRIVRADLFILSLLASATLALLWAYLEATGSAWATVFLGGYLIATTVLFGSVPWSKFSHMFFKPAAAFQKRLAEANGSRSNLPAPADKPATFGSSRRQPRHY